jgi:hypothetical protein
LTGQPVRLATATTVTATSAAKNLSRSARRDGRDDALTREFLHEQVQETGFIDYNGGVKVHQALLSVALHDAPPSDH